MGTRPGRGMLGACLGVCRSGQGMLLPYTWGVSALRGRGGGAGSAAARLTGRVSGNGGAGEWRRPGGEGIGCRAPSVGQAPGKVASEGEDRPSSCSCSARQARDGRPATSRLGCCLARPGCSLSWAPARSSEEGGREGGPTTFAGSWAVERQVHPRPRPGTCPTTFIPDAALRPPHTTDPLPASLPPLPPFSPTRRHHPPSPPPAMPSL